MSSCGAAQLLEMSLRILILVMALATRLPSHIVYWCLIWAFRFCISVYLFVFFFFSSLAAVYVIHEDYLGSSLAGAPRGGFMRKIGDRWCLCFTYSGCVSRDRTMCLYEVDEWYVLILCCCVPWRLLSTFWAGLCDVL
ncbi:hypothetical protein F5Y01DRAFT_297678 [Xylaria sp. FL0043]|nr:hypothetical protein F5Y01DRAFT_297678 [Xylaria sp. FL0043]